MHMPTDPQAAALLSHILAQTRENVEFLVSNNYISAADAADISARLDTTRNDPMVNGVQTMTIAEGPRRVPPPPQRAQAQRARALWAYNQNGQEPNDLSFSAGEVVEIIDETNADWWTGKCRGRQGLFPSNYVEKLAASGSPPPPPQPVPFAPMPSAQVQPTYFPPVAQKPAYRPFGAAHQAVNQPPPAGVNTIGLQQDPQQEQKKSKYGKLGDTMATSAAGGVGFGAGAAIGSGIIGAIF